MIELVDDPWTRGARDRMVAEQLRRRAITDARVLATMRTLPRHYFVPRELVRSAYEDRPVLIGQGQTISQPYIVAYMTQALELEGTESVLEIGTGCGYQTAVLAELAGEVHTIEIVPELASRAEQLLLQLGYRNIHFRVGDGYGGWPEAAPFDRILVTAAPDHVPDLLVEQLVIGGRLLLPVGGELQHLVTLDRKPEGLVRHTLIPVRFVPMTGVAGKPRGGTP